MSPYIHPLTKITDIDQYFRKDPKNFSMTFIGESLEVRIPQRFQTYGLLSIGDSTTTLGVMDLIIDDKYHAGLNILASITIEQSDISQMTYKNIDYIVLKLKTNDVFMTSYRVIQDPGVVYALWTDMITSGNIYYWFWEYSDLLKLFENARELTGQGIGVSRSVFEGIIAHLARDNRQQSLQYRLTDMKRPMKFVALNSVSGAPTSTIARLNGSYFRNEGLTSALRYQVDQPQPFENILRGLVDSPLEEPSQ